MILATSIAYGVAVGAAALVTLIGGKHLKDGLDAQYWKRRWDKLIESFDDTNKQLTFYRNAYYRLEAQHIELTKKYQALVDAKTNSFDTPLDCQ